MFHRDVAYFGWTGVILFFVLSGYLITKVLMVENEKQTPLITKLKNFWTRRILRIFPLYYLYLIVLTIVLLRWTFPQIVLEMPSLFTYTYNFYLIHVYDLHGPSFLAGHFWSLSIEEQFYIFYPFLIFLCKRKQLQIAVVGLIVFSVLFRLFFREYHVSYLGNSDGYSNYHPFSYLDSFLCGAAIFIFRLDKIKPSIQYLLFFFSLLITIISGLLIYMDINGGATFNVRNYLSSFGIEAHYAKNFYRVWGLFQLNLLFSSLLILLLTGAKNKIHLWLKGFFELRPLIAIGKVSYGMYVFHGIVIWVLLQIFNYESSGMNKYVFFLLSLSAVWIVSFAVYHLYEKRFLILKERLRERFDEETGSTAIPLGEGYSMAEVINSDIKK
jgi:peptidoglycan/LPS O-acetylase OafA/YrhL